MVPWGLPSPPLHVVFPTVSLTIVETLQALWRPARARRECPVLSIYIDAEVVPVID